MDSVFWDRIEKTDGCWLWMGYVEHTGYGRLMIDGVRKQAHRVAYELTQGKIPIGFLVCHKCDNPLCVRPDHLFLGTHKDNIDDMFSKGRNKHFRGSEYPLSKLTETKIQEIRALVRSGWGQKDVAVKFGIHQCNVSRIMSGKRWSHLA